MPARQREAGRARTQESSVTSALLPESPARKGGREPRVPAAGTWGQAAGEEAEWGWGQALLVTLT